MRIVFPFLLAIVSFSCNAQAILKSIFHPYDAFVYGLSVMPNSNGTYSAFSKNYKFKAFFLDSVGNILWTKKIQPPENILLDQDLTVDRIPDSTFIVASTFYRADAVFQFDIIVTKVDLAGHARWMKSWGKKNRHENIYKIRHTQDSGFVFVGTRSDSIMGTTTINAAAYLGKMDSSGNILWSRGFDKSVLEDIAYDIIELDNGFLTAGRTDNDSTGDISYGFLIKTDKNGNQLWTRRYGNPISCITSIIKDSNVFVFTGTTVCAETLAGFAVGDIILSKTDSTGAIIWTKQYDFGDKTTASKVIKTTDGGYLVLGIFGHLSSDSTGCLLIKTDSAGNLQWSRKYGGRAQFYWGNNLMQKSNGDFLASLQYYTDRHVIFMLGTDSLGNNRNVCETSVAPSVYSRNVTDSNFVFPETVIFDTSISVPFTEFDDSLVALDTCHVGTTAVKNIPVVSVSLYPNPSIGLINIESSTAHYEIEIVNAFGNKILFQEVSTSTHTLDLSRYPKGFYICVIHCYGGATSKQGFILH